MKLRSSRMLILAVTGLLVFGAATAVAAANFKSVSFSVNNQGQLVCSGDVSGLGNVSSTPATCSATATATYQCINNGGKNPSAGNKTSVTAPASTGPVNVPVHNGRAQPTILVNPPGAGSFSCPSGQSLFLTSVCYTDITFTVGDATATEAGPVCNTSPILIKQ